MHMLAVYEASQDASEDARKKTVGPQWKGNSGKVTASRRAPRPGPSCLVCWHQLSKGAVTSVDPSIFSTCKVLPHISTFYLGRVDKVQEQLAWGQLTVLPDACSWPTSIPVRTLLAGAGIRGFWLYGRKSPLRPSSELFILASYLDFHCVPSGFLMSNVNGDIKCPQSGQDTYCATCTGVRTWGGMCS